MHVVLMHEGNWFSYTIRTLGTNFSLLQNSAIGQGSAMYGLIGAIQTQDRPYIDYVDGTIMADGTFNSPTQQVWLI